MKSGTQHPEGKRNDKHGVLRDWVGLPDFFHARTS
jgi:hypothetical protein